MKPTVIISFSIFAAMCFLNSCHKTIVTPANTVSAASSIPTLGVNTSLSAIYFATTGATGIGTATGLPTGVTATWAADVIMLSGTPTESGTFNYTIPLTGGSGIVNATGTIIVICDYLPLNVGNKFLYSYYDRFSHPGIYYLEKGECEWEFIEKNRTRPNVYTVRLTFNGIHVENMYGLNYPYFENDTTVISNKIDSLSFQENENGTVTIECPIPYSRTTSFTTERYSECSKTDTCFYSSPDNKICLTKNIGVKSLYSYVGGNHPASTLYTWLKGPY
jgi:hypothetical protein